MSHQNKAVVQQKVVQDGRQLTKNVIKPFHQSQRKMYHLPTIETVPLSDWPQTTTLSSNSRIRSMIPRGSFNKGNCHHLSLRFDATMNTSSGVPTDIFHWFSKIEIRNQYELLQTLYSDSMLFNYLLNVNRDQFALSAEHLGFDRDVLLGGRQDSMASGSTKTFYLPLVNSSIFSADLDWSQLDDIILEFTVASGSPVVSGSGTLTCSCSIVYESHDQHPSQKDAKHSFGSEVVHANSYLDCVRIDRFAASLASGNQYLLPTDSVVGSSPFVLVYTAPAGTNENTKWWSSQDYLGKSGLVNFLSPNGDGILGNSHIRVDVLREETLTKNMKNSLLQDKNGYLILPFTDNWSGASAGIHQGCYQFTQQKNNIMLMPANSKTNQVMTLNVTNAAVLTSGNFRFRIGNEFSAPLAFNATVADVKAAIEALKFCSSNNITVTLSAALSAASAPTLTINSPNITLQDGEVSIDSFAFTGSAVPTSITISTTTQPVFGATGTVDITAYVFVYKTVYQNKSRLTAVLDSY